MALASVEELQQGIACLSRGAYFKEALFDMALSLLTESAAKFAKTDRASIWALTNDHDELLCLESFDRSTKGNRNCGDVLRAVDYPIYFRHLREASAIVADDAFEHPATAEFAADYLPRHGITAVLHSPIHVRGELQGVFCLAQTSTKHAWNAAHRLFAQAVANLVTLSLVEYEAEEARRKASKAEERLKVLFEHSRDPMLLFDDDDGRVMDANRQAETLFGVRRGELAGRSRRQLYQFPSGVDMDRLFARQAAARMPVLAAIRQSDGWPRSIEITTEVVEVAKGRRLALEIIRPAN